MQQQGVPIAWKSNRKAGPRGDDSSSVATHVAVGVGGAGDIGKQRAEFGGARIPEHGEVVE